MLKIALASYAAMIGSVLCDMPTTAYFFAGVSIGATACLIVSYLHHYTKG